MSRRHRTQPDGPVGGPLTELPQDSAERKRIPIYSGFFKYFPDAIVEVANLSFESNEKHNPGEPLHWSKDKSADHLDCIGRHLLEAGGRDPANKNVRHSAQLAWRAFANLQIEIEQERAAASPVAKEPECWCPTCKDGCVPCSQGKHEYSRTGLFRY